MNHLKDCFHRWHCVSGCRKEYWLPCSNGIPLQEINQLYSWISNTVAYRDPEHCHLAFGLGQIYMPHKWLWGKFKVHCFFNRCLDDQFRHASFDLQQLTLWMLFTWHTSVADDKWEWKIDHWLTKSTRDSLPSPHRPSTIVCRPVKQGS